MDGKMPGDAGVKMGGAPGEDAADADNAVEGAAVQGAYALKHILVFPPVFHKEGEEDLARLGKLHGFALTVKERGTQLFFENGNILADCGLRDI